MDSEDREKDWYYYSESSEDSPEERYINEWENKITTDGNLFFVKHHPDKSFMKKDVVENVENRNTTADKTAGILSKFMRRRNSRRGSRRIDKRVNKYDTSVVQAPTLPDIQKENELEESQILIRIGVENTFVGQISVESLLGLKTVNSNNNVVITGFSPNKASLFNSKVSLGDYLQSINGTYITSHNLDAVLLGLGNCKEVLLGFKKVKNDVNDRKQTFQCHNLTNDKVYSTTNGSVIYAKYEGLSEDGPSDQGIIYCFPKKYNVLAQIRGAFFTLSHLLTTVSSSPPRSTTFKLDNNCINVLYFHEKSELLLISLPESKHFVEESARIVNSIVRCLEFMFQTLSRCFSNKQNVEFLDSFFYKLLTKTKVEDIKNCTIWEFESLLPAPCSFCVPKEEYMQIDDALNELESNYIPSQEGQRLFTVLGSCYFYKGYMICNHLPNQDLLDVTALMKENDILKFSKEGVKDFVFWKEVYPSSCQRGLKHSCGAPYSTPVGRWFLLIVGMDHSFLATIFEAGIYSFRTFINKGPSVVYVEETQDTLRHIMKINFPDVINKQLNITTDYVQEFREQIKSASTDSSSSLSSSYADYQVQNRQYSATELYRQHALTGLKGRQSLETIRALGGFVDVDYVLEEDCAPVLGRRAERELALETNSQSRVSVSESVSDDSDWLKDFKGSERNYSDDANESYKSILAEDSIASPRAIREDEKVLIHFVNFEASEGILITSIINNITSSKYLQILQTFRQHAHKIQKIFLNTILFKKIKSQEMPEILNKSLVAINEFGTLFHYVDEDKKDSETYWVVGKLFFMPHPREIYLCYTDTCPQNMVEIAFQIALLSMK